MNEEKCENCRFWLFLSSMGERSTLALGVCRLNPPTKNGNPETYNDHWCGKYEPKTQGRKDGPLRS